MSKQALTVETGVDMSPTRTNFAADWLGPVEALTRFAPTARVTLESDGERKQADLRYGVRICGIGLLIGARVQSEFILPLPVSRVPNTPDWFAGLMNLRGALVPVFDLEALVGVGEDALQSTVAGSRPLFLVLDRGERAAALKIRRFPQTLSGLKPLDEMPPAPSPLDECVGDAFVEDGSAWLEFDHVRLFEAFSWRLAKSGNASVR
jgi:twitching motility protein PilI